MQGIAQQGPGGPEIWVRGPVGDTPPRPVAPQRAASPRRFAWVATHGGAGASTLAAVFGGFDAGRGWPRPDQDEPASVLLVARTHATGLHTALRSLELFQRGEAPPGLDLDAIVLVADAPGRLPRPLAQHVKVIESLLDVYRVPWVPDWRIGDLSGRPPRECASLARLTGSVTSSGSRWGVR
ncbi:DUF6668 family protein [Streptomyces yaanensis]|uniref:DUF6668 family protein n=1 Tax=Streptomyces yaanensis TaxID=1142239 RepID=A0ABV7SK35_9ACTN|nr:DUF6668 family protein [Streptomyces sp. CGMCC 4.7035]WNB97119.1 hypothetical protein Q2K21_02980 [Streptomyces sp. CGMCC 4.7035]